jgi:hypothetical protein
MAAPNLAVTRPKIRSRLINDDDVAEVVKLLSRGFSAQRSHNFWEHVLKRLAERPVLEGYPRYGCLLESDGKPVGVFLQIFSRIWLDGEVKIRCNVSSLYVDPGFRIYAPIFELQIFKCKDVTVLDISPIPSRRAVMEARKYIRYSNGIFMATPVLRQSPSVVSVRLFEASAPPDVSVEAHEYEMLLEHAEFGCLSLWCVTSEGAHPFIFRPRVLKGFLRCVQLVYCREVDEFVRFAWPIGKFLASKLQFLVLIDANGPISGLAGKYFPGKMPRYYRGPDKPRLGDLAYTEVALFGI